MPQGNKWRRIADQLAERLSNYEACPAQHQDPGQAAADCPFCADAVAYAVYVAAGGRDYRGTLIPPGSKSITLPELVQRTREESGRDT